MKKRLENAEKTKSFVLQKVYAKEKIIFKKWENLLKHFSKITNFI